MKILLTSSLAAVCSGGLVYWVLSASEPSSSRESESASALTTAESVRPAARKVTPHLVRTLIDPTLHLEEQVEAVRSLPDDLTAEEFQGLFALFSEPVPDHLTAAHWHTLLNEAMEVLRESRFAHHSYLPSLSVVLQDIHLDPTIRDYAAQHLALHLSTPILQSNPTARKQGLEALLAAAAARRASELQVAGTSLMALCDHFENHPGDLSAHENELGDLLGSIFEGENVSERSLLTSAIQVAGRLQIATHRDLILALSKGEGPLAERFPSLQLSAISALGRYQHPEDRPHLEALASKASPLRFAARNALRSFDN